MSWFNGQFWVDLLDDFDYGKVLSEGLDYLFVLYFVLVSDLVFLSLDDVKGFMLEVGQYNGCLVVLGEGNGNKYDYLYVGMFIYLDVVYDYFLFMVNWMFEMD